MKQNMHHALQSVIDGVNARLPGAHPTVYLYGSVPMGDFRPGWSDIDLLMLTRRALTAIEAEHLVMLRQELTAADPTCPYYRACEGGILSLEAFLAGTDTPVVYWGTSGQRVTTRHHLAAFEWWQLHHQSQLLHGEDVRSLLPCPGYGEMKAAVRAHLQTIREHGSVNAGLYSFGWLLDISRGLYTLRTGAVIPKTAAGEWALREHLCPDERALSLALSVRRDPCACSRDELHARAAGLSEAIQAFANVLEKELLS